MGNSKHVNGKKMDSLNQRKRSPPYLPILALLFFSTIIIVWSGRLYLSQKFTEDILGTDSASESDWNLLAVQNFINDKSKSSEEHEIAEEIFKRYFKAKAESLKLLEDGRFIVLEKQKDDLSFFSHDGFLAKTGGLTWSDNRRFQELMKSAFENIGFTKPVTAQKCEAWFQDKYGMSIDDWQPQPKTSTTGNESFNIDRFQLEIKVFKEIEKNLEALQLKSQNTQAKQVPK